MISTLNVSCWLCVLGLLYPAACGDVPEKHTNCSEGACPARILDEFVDIDAFDDPKDEKVKLLQGVLRTVAGSRKQLLHQRQELVERLQDLDSEIATAESAFGAQQAGGNRTYDATLKGTFGCQDSPGWANGYRQCHEENSDPRLCTPSGWTCAGYEANGWCRSGRVVATFAIGLAFHSPERACCVCGGSGSGSGSCSAYGCGAQYNPKYDCQCNSKCGGYHNCCSDYTTVCSGSCRKYGCDNTFDARRACQCTNECARFSNCCSDYTEVCYSSGTELTTGYHQTAPEICKLIMQSNFRPGSSGWCGGAIYFAVRPEDTVTKAIGENSHDGCMIEAKIRMGRIKKIRPGKSCEGYNSYRAAREGYDSLIFNPGDGDELVVFKPEQVVSKRVLPYNEKWHVPSLRRRRGSPLNL